MNRVLTDAERLAAGLRVTMTNACGTVTGFEQCVDGVVHKFDADMNRITDSATTMAAGVDAATTAAGNSLAEFAGAVFRWQTGPYGGAQGYGQNFEQLFAAGLLDPNQRPGTALVDYYQRTGLKGRFDTGIPGFGVTIRPDGSAILDDGANFRGRVPAFGSGAYVRTPTLAVIGDEGPEYVVREDQMRHGGGRTVIVNVENHAPLLSERDFKDLVIEAVVEAEERGEL